MKILIKHVLFLHLLFAFGVLQAQDIKGIVYEKDGNGHKNPLVGVNIYWAGTTVGVASDAKGNYGINRLNGYDRLVFSYIGYKSDTLVAGPQQRRLEVVLEASREIEGTEITARQAGAHLSLLKPIQTQVITQAELQKAACCNLSESFETNASVDVSYADAISGSKQIQLLGIPGKYSQMMFENIPNLRGLSSTYGLMYIPGPWMESIQVAKGTASVINGYESVSGQINVEYKKPEKSEKLHLNLFLGDVGQIETNVNTAIKINEKWSTGILAHASKTDRKIDHNGDFLLDHPLTEQINVMNRWNYVGPQLESRFGVRVLAESRKGGQMLGLSENAPNLRDPYLIDIKTKHLEAFSKLGWISRQRSSTSVGWITNANYHERNALYGHNNYKGVQQSFYTNLLIQSYINNTAHMFTTGASFQLDHYNEKLNDSSFVANELVPGAFFEYTYNNFDKLILIAGARADYHNDYGFFATPRLHLRYEIDSNTTIRASAGMGYRSARIIAENNQLLATSRRIIIQEKPRMERAVNVGANLSRCFEFNGRLLTISAEAYRTSFLDQVIVDMDRSTSEIYIYNLDGKAFANSYQIEMMWEPIKNLDVVLAYRWSDVKVTQNSELVRKPLINKYKGLVNLSYATNLHKWQFDFTSQFNGDARLPDTQMNPAEYQRPELAPTYTIIHAQVTKFFRKWNIYAGVENLTNFVQKDPIIAANDPYGNYFDSSMVWGPILGRKIYAGIRYTID
ncbi:MAG: TonB-dependent receptor [Bacteroidales bacterium]|nr:TonB-dependent receptor [Bacteroidales bacterium]MDZ4203318.1 TonB-dependent receptor [Bacteroidales bacterium]